MQVEQQLQHQWLSVCLANDRPYSPVLSNRHLDGRHLQRVLADRASILHRIPSLNDNQANKNQDGMCPQVSLSQKRFPIVQALLQRVFQDLMGLYDALRLHEEYSALILLQEVVIATIVDEYQQHVDAILESISFVAHSAFSQAWKEYV